jgi:hypothetical protein
MRPGWYLALFLIAGTAVVGAAAALESPAAATNQGGAAAFQAMLPVLRHPRCMVCHSSGDFPRQGDDLHAHRMNVRRGKNGLGAAPVYCSSCHQDHNLEGVHMPPGAPGWHLPSAQQPLVWQGLSDRELCVLLAQPARNGGMDSKAMEEHMHTPLVSWGWHPGEGRTPIPTGHDAFLHQVSVWTAAGMPCPAR